MAAGGRDGALVGVGEAGEVDVGVGLGGAQHRCADCAGDAQLVHDVGDHAGRIADAFEALDQPLRVLVASVAVLGGAWVLAAAVEIAA